MKAKFILATLLLGAVLLSSCDKDKETELEKTELRGYWVFSKSIYDDGEGGEFLLDYYRPRSYYYFYSDNEMGFMYDGQGGNGYTYYARGAGLVIELPETYGGKVAYTFKVEGNTLRLEFAEGYSHYDDDFEGVKGFILQKANF
jgi:hypothetical protein